MVFAVQPDAAAGIELSHKKAQCCLGLLSHEGIGTTESKAESDR
jgi:hypothetical protein